MTATTLFYLLLVLVLGIWALVVLSYWYGRKLLQKQQQLTNLLLPYLAQVQTERETIHALSIPDTTPLSRLKDINLPDNVQVDFQHHQKSE